VTSPRRRPEDTAEGCRSLAADDRLRAVAMVIPHMRVSHERSADAWVARAELLDGLETSFNQRLAANGRSPAPAR
jgi:hypothetical protein